MSRPWCGRGERNPLSQSVIITVEAALRQPQSQVALEKLSRKLIRNWPGTRRARLHIRYVAALIEANQRIIAMRDRQPPGVEAAA